MMYWQRSFAQLELTKPPENKEESSETWARGDEYIVSISTHTGTKLTSYSYPQGCRRTWGSYLFNNCWESSSRIIHALALSLGLKVGRAGRINARYIGRKRERNTVLVNINGSHRTVSNRFELHSSIRLAVFYIAQLRSMYCFYHPIAPLLTEIILNRPTSSPPYAVPSKTKHN